MSVRVCAKGLLASAQGTIQWGQVYLNIVQLMASGECCRENYDWTENYCITNSEAILDDAMEFLVLGRSAETRREKQI